MKFFAIYCNTQKIEWAIKSWEINYHNIFGISSSILCKKYKNHLFIFGACVKKIVVVKNKIQHNKNVALCMYVTYKMKQLTSSHCFDVLSWKSQWYERVSRERKIKQCRKYVMNFPWRALQNLWNIVCGKILGPLQVNLFLCGFF